MFLVARPLTAADIAEVAAIEAVSHATPWTPGITTSCFRSLGLAQGVMFIPWVIGITFGAILLWDWIMNRSEAISSFVHASVVFVLAYALVF